MSEHRDNINPAYLGLQKIAGVAGVVGLAIVGLYWMRDADTAWASYQYGYIFWTLVSVAGLCWLMVHHLVAGRWGFMTQRVFEAQARLLPLMALLFLPLLLNLGVYPWRDPTSITWPDPQTATHVQEIVQNKVLWLNTKFWILRSVLYFALWCGLGYFLLSWSRKLDATGDRSILSKLTLTSGFGILFSVLAVTFAAVDWTMSLEPEWYSSIYGLYYLIGGGLTAIAFAIVFLTYHCDRAPLAKRYQTDHLQHLGTIMLGFTILWAYVSFSQFLIIWSANLPEEIPFYLKRTDSGLNVIAIFLMVGHFWLPFLLLLQRRVKRSTFNIRNMCYFILAMRVLDFFWVLKPATVHPGEPFPWNLVWLDAAAFIGVGGIWFCAFIWAIQKAPLLVNDPRMIDAFAKDLPHDHHEVTEHAS